MRPEELATLSQVRGLVARGEARSRRLQARLTQAEIAAACGVSAPCIARWEAGDRRPRGAAALRYAHLLDVLGVLHG